VASAWSKAFLLDRGVRHTQRGREAPAPQANPVTTKALETYERLAKDKLEVIKTALALGYSDDEIAKLDTRLDHLIGQDKLQQILQGSGAASVASADLVDTQLEHEIERVRQLRAKG
jgi:hypothetical protein